MANFLLKVETTGLDKDSDTLLQVLLSDIAGNIIYCKTFTCDTLNNNSLMFNNLNNVILSLCPIYSKDQIKTELNDIIKDSTLYSYNKEFDKSFLDLNPTEWIDILSLLPRRRRIPNLDCYKSIPSPIYRKTLNILELMREHNLIKEDNFSLSF